MQAQGAAGGDPPPPLHAGRQGPGGSSRQQGQAEHSGPSHDSGPSCLQPSPPASVSPGRSHPQPRGRVLIAWLGFAAGSGGPALQMLPWVDTGSPRCPTEHCPQPGASWLCSGTRAPRRDGSHGGVAWGDKPPTRPGVGRKEEAAEPCPAPHGSLCPGCPCRPAQPPPARRQAGSTAGRRQGRGGRLAAARVMWGAGGQVGGRGGSARRGGPGHYLQCQWVSWVC